MSLRDRVSNELLRAGLDALRDQLYIEEHRCRIRMPVRWDTGELCRDDHYWPQWCAAVKGIQEVEIILDTPDEHRLRPLWATEAA